MIKAQISEIFLSIQGEGKYLGEEQCFVRFYNCEVGCDFCDTKPQTYKEYTASELIDKIKETIGQNKIAVISLTGGEPLLQRNFLLEFLPVLKRGGFRIYLETNGVLYNELFDILDYIDIIAMDIKLPSSTKQRAYWTEHEEFLKTAKNKDVFIKVVICLDTVLEDLKNAVNLVSQIKKDTAFILQPNSEELGRDLADKLQEFKKYAKEDLSDVRVIPQLHKIVGVK